MTDMPLALKYRPRTFEDFAGQQLAVRVLSEMVKQARIPTGLLFVGPSGTGKRLRFGTPILTPTGWVPIESLAVGDLVVGSSGTATTVTAVSEPVVRPLFRVTLNDGAWVDADDEHLWTVVTKRGIRHTLTTRELRGRSLARLYLPEVSPAQHPEQDLPIPPYMLGGLLADGSLHGNGTTVWTKNSSEVAEEMRVSAKSGDWDLQEISVEGHTRRYRFTHPDDVIGHRSVLKNVLRELGLRVPSAEKFIPSQYLLASEQQRRDLLAGLMDGDGRLSAKGAPQYHSTSERLVRDVQQLAWSLGESVSVQGKKLDGTWCVHFLSLGQVHRASERLNSDRPRRLERRRIVSIEAVGEDWGRCIAVDAPDHLYLTRDYIPTHNTSAARVLSRAMCPEDDGRSILEIDAASNGRVESIRDLLSRLRFSTGGKWRFVVIDEAHSMTREAFNALLKALEEPASGTVFILASTEPHKIPKTVAHRLMEFEFSRVSVSEIVDRLVLVAQREGLKQETALLQHLAIEANGSVRRALMLLEKADMASITTLAEWKTLTRVVDVSLPTLEELSRAQLAPAFQLVDQSMAMLSSPSVLVDQIIATLRDLLVLRAGGAIEADGADLASRKKLSVDLPASHIVAAMNLCWDYKTKLRVHDDPVGSINLLVSLIGNVFLQNREVPRPVLRVVPDPAPEAPVQKITLAEMMQ